MQNGAKTIAESIREGKLLNQKKREVKFDQKNKKKKGINLEELLGDENENTNIDKGLSDKLDSGIKQNKRIKLDESLKELIPFNKEMIKASVIAE